MAALGCSIRQYGADFAEVGLMCYKSQGLGFFLKSGHLMYALATTTPLGSGVCLLW